MQQDELINENADPAPEQSDLTTATRIEPVEIDIVANALPSAAQTADSHSDSALTMCARILSVVFNPLLIPTYAVILSFQVTVLQYVKSQLQWLTVLVALALTGIIPMVVIYLLYAFKIVSSTNLERRKERIIPYSAAFLGYCGCALYLYGVNAPAWMWLFMVGGAVALLIVDVVNIWWKISAHSAAVGGMVGLCFFMIKYGQAMTDITYLTMIVIVVAGMVCTARLILRRHTLWQIAAGFATGVISVLLFATLSGIEPLN